MYALRKGGPATAAAANASARSTHARKALCLGRHSLEARVPGAGRALVGSFHSARLGGNGDGNGPRRRPLESCSLSSSAWGAASPLPFSGTIGAPAWAGGGSRGGRGMASWTPSDSHRLGAIVADAALTLRESLSQKIPKGFENFFPKEKDGGDSKKGLREKGDSESSSGKEGIGMSSSGDKGSDDKGGQEGTGGGGGGGGGERRMPGGPEMLLAVAVVAFLYSLAADSGSGPARRPVEITWQDFNNLLLESGKVERIVVANHSTARVVMREAVDLRAMAEERGSGVGGGAAATTSRSEDGGLGNPDRNWGGSDGVDRGGVGGVDDWRTGKIGSERDLLRERIPPSYQFEIGSVDTFERKLEESQRNMGINPRDFIPVQYVTETSSSQGILRVIGGLLPTLAVIGTIVYLSRGRGGAGGGPGGIGKVFKMMDSTATRVKPDSVKVTFKDVAGVDEAKKEIMEFVEFLKTPKKFTDLGAKIPKGALLSGPPGTGKTLLAKATAGEAKVPFFTISGSDFIEMFVGVGPGRVRDLFKEARKNAPCIVFIDEIDAVGRKRGKGQFGGGNDERENTLNQLLVEMDGFSSNTNVVVLAGTNRVDVLDPALTRPGRFDRQITVDKPDIQGRKAIFDVHLKGLNLGGKSGDFSGRLAGLTPGFVGADIENLCNEAAIVAARRNKKKIEMDDFEAATDRVIGGLESNKLIMPEEKKIVAYHEAGHAVAGWNLEHADPLLKVTIVPRGASTLGYAQYLPKEVFLRTREQITDIICMALAGRASEQVHFGDVTTGASDDLRRVTAMVYQMIGVYGMGDGIGQLAFPQDNSSGYPQEKPYSDATAERMDLEARKMVDSAYQRTLELVQDKKEQIRMVAELLLEKETINHDDLVSLIGARPFKAHKSYLEFISAQEDAKQKDADAAETAEAGAKAKADAGAGGEGGKVGGVAEGGEAAATAAAKAGVGAEATTRSKEP